MKTSKCQCISSIFIFFNFFFYKVPKNTLKYFNILHIFNFLAFFVSYYKKAYNNAFRTIFSSKIIVICLFFFYLLIKYSFKFFCFYFFSFKKYSCNHMQFLYILRKKLFCSSISNIYNFFSFFINY